jgi:hypothetical protein
VIKIKIYDDEFSFMFKCTCFQEKVTYAAPRIAAALTATFFAPAYLQL